MARRKERTPEGILVGPGTLLVVSEGGGIAPPIIESDPNDTIGTALDLLRSAGSVGISRILGSEEESEASWRRVQSDME